MESPDPIHAHPQSRDKDESVHGNSAPVQTVRIEFTERAIAIIAIVLGSASLIGMFWAVHESTKAEREARMLQYYVLEMDAKLIAAGVKKPEDAVAKKLEK